MVLLGIGRGRRLEGLLCSFPVGSEVLCLGRGVVRAVSGGDIYLEKKTTIERIVDAVGEKSIRDFLKIRDKEKRK